MTPKQESQLLKVLIELLSETKKQNDRLARLEATADRMAARAGARV